MRITGIILLLLCAFTPAWAETALLQKVVPYEDNSLQGKTANGAEIIVKVNVQPVLNSDWVYVKLDKEQQGLEPGIIIFDQQGRQISRVRNFDPASCLYLSLSPARDVLALDSGNEQERTWTFMALPDYRVMGQPVKYSQTLDESRADLVWLNETFVLLPRLNPPQERELKCGDQQNCGNHSVYLYNLRDQVLMPLFRGTDLCDYFYTGFEHPIIFGEKVCVTEVADWAKPNKETTSTRVMGALPEHYKPEGKGGM